MDATARDHARQFGAFHVMTKPVGPICNLDCKYCFYLEKERLYPSDESFRMSDAVLESYVRQYIEAQDVPEVNFAWQGGEPTLLGVGFFRRVVELQKQYCPAGKRVTNAIQTNAVLLDDEWCEFLRDNGFLVGVSIDGPREMHDRYRVDKEGHPTFDRVMRGLELLKSHRVEFNTLTVVNRLNSRHPLEVYRFLKQQGSGFIQFIPLVERKPDDDAKSMGLDFSAPPIPSESDANSPVTPWSVESKPYGEFLVTIFDEWIRHDVGKVFVQLFDVALGNWMGLGSSLCVFAETCGTALAIEHNGDLYSCDHYVYPRYRLGNILNQTLGDMVNSPEQVKFGNDKLDSLPRYCRECDVRFACNGECPKHRFIRAPDGEPGLNYLCPAYKRFFKHIDPYMRTMGELLRSGQTAAAIMPLMAAQEQQVRWQSAARNDPCPCGSGKKFKVCCSAKLNGTRLRAS
jgi:uncharacterized protein